MKNPPAYPIPDSNYGTGMSFLDHFAGLAMQGLLGDNKNIPLTTTCELVAEKSYNIARAMLEERAKPENQL